MAKIDLINKTVFDFTSDISILSMVVRFDPNNKDDKDLYIKQGSPITKAIDIALFANLTGDKSLERDALKYADALEDEDFESNPEIIVD